MTKNDNQIDENVQISLEENNLVGTEEKQDNPVAQELNDENKQILFRIFIIVLQKLMFCSRCLA